MATIKDVARLANVSIATVSNIINNKKNVNIDIYNRVIKVMKELNYHPNLLAKNLKNNSMMFIGVIIPHMNGYYGQMLNGINQIIEDNKCQLIIKGIKDNKNDGTQKIVDLINLGVKGIICVLPNINENLFNELISYRRPLVLLDHYLVNKDCNFVKFDNEGTVYLLTKEIIKERSKSVCLITGSTYMGSEADCLAGFLKAINEENFDNSKINSYEVDLSKERAFAQLLEILINIKEIPDCFVISNEFIAESLYEVLSFLGHSNKKVYSLSGDNWCTRNENGNIYKIRRNAIQCGIEAAKLLLEQIDAPLVFDTQQVKVDNLYNLYDKSYIDDKSCKPVNKPNSKKIKALLLDAPMSQAFIKLLPDFKQKTGIDVEYDYMNQKDLRRKMMENWQHENNHYDVYMIDMPWLPTMINKKYLFKLNDLIDINKLSSNYVSIIKSVLFDKKEIYAVPVDVGSQILVCRSNLFEDKMIQKEFYIKHGIELQIPRTWREFNLISKFFTREFNHNSPTKYGTCILGYAPTGLIEEFLPRQWSYNGKMFSGQDTSIYSVQNIKALKNLCECFKYSYPECVNFMEDEQINEFINNDIAMINTYNLHISRYQKELGQIENDIKYYAMPGNVSLMGGWLLGINKFSREPDLGAKFIEWVVSDDISVQCSMLGGIIPKKNVFLNNEVQSEHPWLREIDLKIGSSRIREEIFNGEGEIISNYEFEEYLARYIEKAIHQECSPEDALKKAHMFFAKRMSNT